MPFYQAKNGNYVVDWDHTPDDTHFRMHIHSPDQHHAGPLISIDDHAETLRWALELAEQMTGPIHLVPYSGVEALGKPELQRAAMLLDEGEREELRRFAVGQLAEIMRDSFERRTRSDAHDLLVQITGAKQ